MHHPLPPHLREQLDAFRQRLLAQESLLTCAAMFGSLAASALAVFALDRFWETPHLLRLGLLATGAGLAVWAGLRWLRHWVLRPRDDRQLSVLVQRHHRPLGDTLLSAIELAEGRITDDSISPELRLAAITSIADRAAQVDFTRAVRWRLAARLTLGCLAGALMLGAIGWFSVPALRSTLLRWINPFGALARHTFTRFNPLDPVRVVARGEPFTVTCSLDPASEWKPDHLQYQCGALRPGMVAAADPSVIHLDGQSEAVDLRLRAGDCTQTIQIRPELRPALAGLNARVSLPAYLQRPVGTEACTDLLTVVEGSSLSFEGTASRALQSLRATLGGRPLPATLQGANFTTPTVPAVDNDRLRLEWTDTLQLAGAAPYEVALKLKPDTLPEVRATSLAGATGMLADQTLQIPLQATDDFGIQQVTVHCRPVAGKNPGHLPAEQIWTAAAGAPDQTLSETTFAFSPHLLNIPDGTWVELQFGARDYCPGHAESLSRVHTIQVLSRAEHAKLIQDQMQALGDKLENIAVHEEQAKNDNDALAKLPDKQLTAEEATRKMAEQAKAEMANADALKDLAQQMKETAREAMRNKDIPKSTLDQLAQMSAAMDQLADRNMPKAAQSVADAENQPGAKERQKNLQDAVAEQEKILKALRETAKKLDKAQKRIDADSFINRLKRAAEQQTALVAQAKQASPRLVGIIPAAMTPAQAKEFGALLAAQKQLAEDARIIGDDLAASFERTHLPPYQAVTRDMEKQKMLPRNQALIDDTAANRLFVLIGKGPAMAKLYDKWAELLEEDKKQNGGGGGGGKSDGKIPPELLMALLQMIQSEQEIRAETRAADSLARQRLAALDAAPGVVADNRPQALAEARQAAGRIGDSQTQLHRDLNGLLDQYDPPPSGDPGEALDEALADAVPGFGDYSGKGAGQRLPPQLVELLGMTGTAMGDASDLLGRGQTASPAIAAETEAIELLARLFKQAASQSPSQASAMMQSMMESMMQGSGKGQAKAKGKGSSPGQGQTGSGAVAASSHDAHQGGTPPREGDHAGGKTAGRIPPEYRAAIEAYHARLDKLESVHPTGEKQP